MRRVFLVSLILVVTLVLGPAKASDQYITLASTTSTEQSGLFRHIVPTFREATGIDVRVVAVGTGQALNIGRRGDADALLVHDRLAEERFVDDGYGLDRRDVMYNDFILIGPESDPADVAGVDSVLDAFRRIAGAGASFASRGDDSGTHRKERQIWSEAGIEPAGRWYRELGSGMGAALNTAAGMDAYVLADRASWLSFRNRQELTLLHEGDDALFNPYGSILVHPDRHRSVKADLARQWHEWLVSEEGQKAIASFKVRDEQLFFPYAQ
ncbi:MAG: substrate-binding domain-containing protein [Ectothiorhodospiraceae bacterium]|nr:substrate-binding domain-containing protein [Ectothiorhodospiraceae bacterium]MCH8504519.1 substrate-binding domain-containing protein [Ectothiorhodospiraceae bacterium]